MRQQLVHATYEDDMHLNSQVIEEMQRWHDQMHRWSVCFIFLKVWDAQGGCHHRCFKFRLGRVLETSRPLRPAQGRGARLLATDRRGNEQPHSRELSGVKLTVRAAVPSLRGRVVLVETDDKETQAYISHLGGRSPFLWSMCHHAQILLFAIHRPGKVNTQADRLPR